MRFRGSRFAVTALVAVAASCSPASARRPPDAAPTAPTTAPRPAGTPPVAPTSPTSVPGNGAGGGTANASQPQDQANPASRSQPPASSPPGSPGATPPEDGITAAAGGPVGGFARVLLRPQPASRIVAEVLSQDGAAPRAATVQHLADVLHDASGGKDTSTRQGSIAGGARSWSQAELADAADRSTGVRQGTGGTAVVHLLYLHGDYGGDQSVLGVAVRGDVLAVFVDQLAASASVAVPERVLEDAVTVHEAGHLLGLVDLVLRTGRQDPEHPGHSSNRSSVMYWAVDTDLVSQLLQGGPATGFDDADQRDLATIRAGG